VANYNWRDDGKEMEGPEGGCHPSEIRYARHWCEFHGAGRAPRLNSLSGVRKAEFNGAGRWRSCVGVGRDLKGLRSDVRGQSRGRRAEKGWLDDSLREG